LQTSLVVVDSHVHACTSKHAHFATSARRVYWSNTSPVNIYFGAQISFGIGRQFWAQNTGQIPLLALFILALPERPVRLLSSLSPAGSGEPRAAETRANATPPSYADSISSSPLPPPPPNTNPRYGPMAAAAAAAARQRVMVTHTGG
jgi:hypothetical protein